MKISDLDQSKLIVEVWTRPLLREEETKLKLVIVVSKDPLNRLLLTEDLNLFNEFFSCLSDDSVG